MNIHLFLNIWVNWSSYINIDTNTELDEAKSVYYTYQHSNNCHKRSFQRSLYFFIGIHVSNTSSDYIRQFLFNDLYTDCSTFIRVKNSSYLMYKVINIIYHIYMIKVWSIMFYIIVDTKRSLAGVKLFLTIIDFFKLFWKPFSSMKFMIYPWNRNFFCFLILSISSIVLLTAINKS